MILQQTEQSLSSPPRMIISPQEIDSKCTSIDMEIHPDKYSLLIKGKTSNHSFQIHGIPTSNIKPNPTKFLVPLKKN